MKPTLLIFTAFVLCTTNAHSSNPEVAKLQGNVQDMIDTFRELKFTNALLISQLSPRNPHANLIRRVLLWTNDILTSKLLYFRTYPFVRHTEDNYAHLEFVAPAANEFIHGIQHAMEPIRQYMKLFSHSIVNALRKQVDDAVWFKLYDLARRFAQALDEWTVLAQDRNQKIASALENTGNVVTPEAANLFSESVKLHIANIAETGRIANEINNEIQK